MSWLASWWDWFAAQWNWSFVIPIAVTVGFIVAFVMAARQIRGSDPSDDGGAQSTECADSSHRDQGTRDRVLDHRQPVLILGKIHHDFFHYCFH